MRIGIIGNGNVGSALGPNIAAAGHEVAYGVRDPAKGAGDDGIPLKSVRDAASGAEVVILAIHWGVVDDVLAQCGDLAGKVLVDCTNPYDFQNKLAPLVPPDQSAAKIIAGKTAARVVKAFNQVGAAVMAEAPHRKARPLQFVASDDEAARATVLKLAREIGFDARDGGGLDYARELEGLARLWIAQAFFHSMDGATGWLLATE